MIRFDKQNKIFYLDTLNTTYAFGVFEDKAVVHLYWGKKLVNDLPQNIYAEWGKRSFSASDLTKQSTNCMPLEFSTYGSADMRIPSFNATYGDGSMISKFKFSGYEITSGKPKLAGLPSTYTESTDKTDTLTIELKDERTNMAAYISYTVFEDFDAITRSSKFVNGGDKVSVRAAMSATLDFSGITDYDIVHLDGAWARERYITRNKIVSGNQNVESRYGASSAMHNPFIALCDKNATENSGDVYGFNLVYSGNFTAGVDLDAYGFARAYIGINPFNFNYVLENGESFQTPEAVLVYSDKGFGEMSRRYHNFYRKRLCRGKYRDSERFVLINNWEATYFNFNEEKIYEIAKKASKIGVDTMVLDDGWFGKRNNDDCSLGDWKVNTDKLKGGLSPLIKKVNELGMHFGLWFEPEMISRNSDLYREHPDWALQVKGIESTESRQQLTLDMSRKDVCDYVINAVSDILRNNNIEYVKWDMNRYMTEPGSLLLPPEKQGEVMHRYMLGLYYVLETITSEFTNVLFESCAGGGGRFDAGMLAFMPQTWTSDNTDALDRLFIQYGTSLVYPFSAMGAHVSAVPNHQLKRTTPFEMRCNVAMLGQFGFELDLNKCSDAELETAQNAIKTYRELGRVFHFGDCYRISSPFETDISAMQFVSEDKNTVVLAINSKFAHANAGYTYLRLEGLCENAKYKLRNTAETFGGDYLMNNGVKFVNDTADLSCLKVFDKI